LPCPIRFLRPWFGRDRLPWPWLVSFGGPGWWLMCDAPAFARTAMIYQVAIADRFQVLVAVQT
jgi:hypothetical protein